MTIEGLLGKKLGMLQIFDDVGRLRGVTAIEVGPCYVSQIKSPERDGYSAIQVGFDEVKKLNKPEKGHLAAAGRSLRRLAEFRTSGESDYAVGDEIKADIFETGSRVDVTATSKGRGFQGGVRRHGFRGGPRTHGQSDRHRAPGSIGSGTTPGRVFKGTRMAGHMGAERTTVMNLEVVARNDDRNVIFVAGSVPGPNGGLVRVRNVSQGGALVKLQVVDTTGKKLRTIEAADEVFDIDPNRAVLHQAYVAQMANRRAGTGSTKTRGEVRGSKAKLRRQKGLGRARVGTNRSGTRVGGGIIFGSRPRSFAKDLPATMRRLALRSALSSHARSGGLLVVDGLVPDEPKTKNIAATLKAVGAERRALLVSGSPEAHLTRAARNLPNARSMPAANLNVVDLVNAHHLLLTEDAVREIESRWGGENVKPSRGKKQEAG